MKRKDDFLMQNVAGANLVVPLGSQVVNMNGIVTLNDTGGYLWTLLEQDRSISELAVAMAERFDVKLEDANTDVHNFVEELARLELLE